MVTLYVPAGVSGVPLEDWLALPAPHAVPNQHPQSIRTIRQKLRTLFAAGRLIFAPPMKLTERKIAGIIRLRASKMLGCRPDGGKSIAASGPIVATESVAVPALFATVIDESEHVAAGLAMGATAQVREMLDGSIPFSMLMVMVDVAEAPGETDDGDKAPAEIEKFGEPTITLVAGEVLVLKLPSPLYTAVIFCVPAAKVETEYVAMPLTFNEAVPSCVVPLRNETVPVGVPA
jgi:hypothetical protein